MENNYKNTFGLDISNSALTAVELGYGKTGLRVLNYSRIELEPGIIESNCIIINPQAFKDAVSKLLLDANNGPIRSKNAIISIPEEKTFNHYLSIPKERAKDDEFILNAAKDYIPITLDEAVADYKQVKGRTAGDETTFNFCAVQKGIVDSLIGTLKEINLNVVAIDVSKNSLIRYCNNRFSKNEGDFMIINTEMKKSSLEIATSGGFSYNLDINIGGREFDQKIKDVLNLPTTENVRTLLLKFYEDPNAISAEQQQVIQKALEEYFQVFIKKTTELIQAAENQGPLQINTIYLMGYHSRIPGFKEAFSKAFPNVEIRQQLGYVKINTITELFFPEAIGLALRAVLPEADESDVNLISCEKREELFENKITPAIRKYLLVFALVFGVLLMLVGIGTTKAFTEHKVSAQEAMLLDEKAMNPYLTEAAKAKQQKSQLENQMLTILKDSVPGSQIMKKMDSYNRNGITMINSNYSVTKDGKIEMRLRAKTVSRKETEDFIIELEEDPYYLEVTSPLSNLAGKGERFIDIDLKIDPDVVVNDFIGKTEDLSDSPENKEVTEESASGSILQPAGDEGSIENEQSAENEETEESDQPKPKKPAIQTPPETVPEE
jgi:type IV pilus assembly protein PilM